MKLKIGDIVRHKATNQKMVVISYEGDGGDPDESVGCRYQNKKGFYDGQFFGKVELVKEVEDGNDE